MSNQFQSFAKVDKEKVIAAAQNFILKDDDWRKAQRELVIWDLLDFNFWKRIYRLGKFSQFGPKTADEILKNLEKSDPWGLYSKIKCSWVLDWEKVEKAKNLVSLCRQTFENFIYLTASDASFVEKWSK